MSKPMKRSEIGKRILNLKKSGDSFNVETPYERQMAVNEILVLKRYGLIKLQVVTKADEAKGGWRVVAI